MSKCCTNKKYDFCTVSGHSVRAKTFTIPTATADWGLKFTVYTPNSTAAVEEWNVGNGKLLRDNDQTWRIPNHLETLPSGEYVYVACYTIGGDEYVAFRGNITVETHI